MRAWTRHLETLALLLIGLGGPLAYLAVSPVYSSGDEAAHVDYAYQVWQGRLPVFEDGLSLDNTTGVHPPVQWTAHHPPLFYLLLAPVVGPLADAGHVDAAGLAARAVVCCLAAALVLAVRWFGRLALPGTPAVGTLAAVVTGASVWFIRLGGSVYNDILAALAITLAAAFLLAMTRSPSHRWYTIGFILALCAAALTRISLLPLCFVLLVLLLIQRWWREKRPFLRAVALPFAAGCAVLVASGWFYVRNLQLTGNFSGRHPDWAVAHTSRVPRPFLEVASDSEFWTTMLQQFATSTIDAMPWTLAPQYGTLVLLVLPALAGLLIALRPRRSGFHPLALVIALLVFTVVAAMQIQHVAGAGSALPRYFFAWVPFVAPLIALALWRAPLRWLVILAWLGARLAMTAAEFDAVLARVWDRPQAPVYPAVVWTGFAMLTVGALLACLTLYVQHRSSRTSADQLAPA
ncbi:hypothetical protein EHW97_01055 [Aeromicrobium camelliae]|uniref:Glycosyltransferase RgtA/B/C/D-like domain-containing protein n=1 Tax=Aeromicrobium camelliae TaxID=1538144 RepID=A0A3N6WYJ6_9ACTN|nr:hypothetical protein [Aeromicrobium camelliae]RQN10112.1 hypothetical protein EHW97_01055 [Aeromicrobium camelliae]